MFMTYIKTPKYENKERLIEQTNLLIEEVKRLMKNRIKEIEDSMIGEKKANCLSLEQETRILKEKLIKVERLKNEFIYHKEQSMLLGQPIHFPWNRMLIRLYHSHCLYSKKDFDFDTISNPKNTAAYKKLLHEKQ